MRFENIANLCALFVPPLAFALGLFLLRDDPRFGWIRAFDPPAELLVLFVSGALATGAGMLDWHYHRQGRRVVSSRESRAELLALAGGGIPLFFLMAAATAAVKPGRFLVPILLVVLYTAAAISYDELRFHRRVTAIERLYHATLVTGNAIAWLAWMHYVFARSLS